MYEREEPLRILPKRQTPAPVRDPLTSDSDSDQSEATPPKSKQLKCDDKSKVKVSTAESEGGGCEKNETKRKKVKRGKRMEKKPVVISPWSPPRRIASLNAQVCELFLLSLVLLITTCLSLPCTNSH